MKIPLFFYGFNGYISLLHFMSFIEFRGTFHYDVTTLILYFVVVIIFCLICKLLYLHTDFICLFKCSSKALT